jgi:hypothetical protein
VSCDRFVTKRQRLDNSNCEREVEAAFNLRPTDENTLVMRRSLGKGRPVRTAGGRSPLLGTRLIRSWRRAEGEGRCDGRPGRAMIDAELVRHLVYQP